MQIVLNLMQILVPVWNIHPRIICKRIQTRAKFSAPPFKYMNRVHIEESVNPKQAGGGGFDAPPPSSFYDLALLFSTLSP